MKVVFVLSVFPKYSETFVVDQILGLKKKGFEVQVLSISQGEVPEQATLVELDLHELCIFVFESEALNYSMLKKFFVRFKAVFPSLWRAKLLNHLPSLGISYYSRNLAIAGAMARLRAPLVADLIISHFGPLGAYAQRLRELGLLEGKLVTIFHGADITNYSLLKRHRKDYEILFSKGELMLPVSQLWKNKLISLGCDPKRITVHRMGVNLNKFVFHCPAPYSRDRPLRLLSIARLVEKKGLYYLCEAILYLRKKGVETQLEIIGDGPLKSFLSDFVYKNSLEDSIRLSGQQSRQYVQEALRLADLFVLPSVTANDGDMEGIPVSLMEAMATGTPCLSTFHSGIPELIVDGESGILVKERDCQALVNRLTLVAEGKYDLVRLAINARRTIEQHYNQAILLDQLAMLLTRVSSPGHGEVEDEGTKQLLGNA